MNGVSIGCRLCNGTERVEGFTCPCCLGSGSFEKTTCPHRLIKANEGGEDGLELGSGVVWNAYLIHQNLLGRFASNDYLFPCPLFRERLGMCLSVLELVGVERTQKFNSRG